MNVQSGNSSQIWKEGKSRRAEMKAKHEVKFGVKIE